jgi:glutamate-5-semialdehyde dehydrogenase
MMNTLPYVAHAARAAARVVASLPTATKNSVLLDIASRLRQAAPDLLRVNATDVASAAQQGLAPAKIARLALTPASIEQLAQGLEAVAALPDPVGQVTDDRVVSNGTRVRRVRIPLGVIAMIYESRPGVTLDAFALCFKSGNSVLLKGGREAAASNAALAAIAHAALQAASIPTACLANLTEVGREQVRELLGMHTLIDLVIPRGGEELIRSVLDHSRIPTIQHFKGVCHVYVHEKANLARALDVCVNGKVSAPATCNATECVLIDEAVAQAFVPMLAQAMHAHGVSTRGCDVCCSLSPVVTPATESDFGTEFLAPILAMKVVANSHAAIEHIHVYGSNHTEAILTDDHDAAQHFVRAVHASCVLVNASTRLNDGFQLGLGAEIGISTSRLHAYGPMGLEELTTRRFVVEGAYHQRT